MISPTWYTYTPRRLPHIQFLIQFLIYNSSYTIPRIQILIWLIFTRTVTPLEIFRWFPQIVFSLLPCVRPINVGFSNRFFRLSDKRCLMLIIKKNVEEDKSMVRFLALKIVFFRGFENYIILSYKSYTVTKSGISPQQIGSLQNLKVKFIR